MMKDDSSFRDPAGFIFYENNNVYRLVHKSYQENYEWLIRSGLYNDLTTNHLLINHQEVRKGSLEEDFYLILSPQKMPFISYPYEWSFGQLKDAALHTLKIQERALFKSMILKDASAYNIQFDNGPIFIDLLSFEKYTEGMPWLAYRQFCRNFLAPLLIMAHLDLRLNKLLSNFYDGIPLDLASKMLPKKTWFSPGALINIHLNSIIEKSINPSKKFFNQQSLLQLNSFLYNFINGINTKPGSSYWSEYYVNSYYNADEQRIKEEVVKELIIQIQPKMVWDIGANKGNFSYLAAKRGIFTVAIDNDPLTVEFNYQSTKINQGRCLPLFVDFLNPSAAIGFANQERMTLFERGPADLVMALAVLHHFVLANNITLEILAKLFSKTARHLVMEFIAPDDPAVIGGAWPKSNLLSYNQINFESIFKNYFKVRGVNRINSTRSIYWLVNENNI